MLTLPIRGERGGSYASGEARRGPRAGCSSAGPPPSAINDRLIAQKGALTALLHAELREVEEYGSTSIRSLKDEVRRAPPSGRRLCAGTARPGARRRPPGVLPTLPVRTRARLAQVATLQANARAEHERREQQKDELETQLRDTRRDLANERAGRAWDTTRLRTEVASLCAEATSLEDDLHASRQAHADEAHDAWSQLATEKAGRAADNERGAREAADASEARRLHVADLEERMHQARVEAEENQAELQRALQGLEFEKAQAEAGLRTELQVLGEEKMKRELSLTHQLRKLEDEKEEESRLLNNRVNRLQALQEQALAQGASPRGRAMLYYDSMKSKTKLNGSASWRGENDVNPIAAAAAMAATAAAAVSGGAKSPLGGGVQEG